MLGIIIPTHNRIKDMVKSLNIMKSNNVLHNIDTKIVIVFDGNIISDKERNEIYMSNPSNNTIDIIENRDHIGQNKARNIAINKLRKYNCKDILFLDDDASISSNEELIKYRKMLEKYEDAGCIGLKVIVESTGENQYYNNYNKENELFPVVYPCLAGTIIRGNIVFKYDKFFFPEEIKYGSDEWSLALRVRSENYNVYATDMIECVHRLSQGGRSKKIRYNLQYAHGYIWGILPKEIGKPLVYSRAMSILLKFNFETRYIKQRLNGLYKGNKDGKNQKFEILKKYNVHFHDENFMKQSIIDAHNNSSKGRYTAKLFK